ncbi:MAG: PSD1 domain-containing protein, partial [Acidobacteria bacterium]|nr:PSD1 domain-containing protein [Acidobacteriota bacterium]
MRLAAIAILPLVVASAGAQTARQILTENCASCHGAAQKLSGLDLTSREAMLHGGNRGPAVVPGEASKSLLIAAIERKGPLKMPPGQALAAAAVAALREWIDTGAPWEAAAAAAQPKWKSNAEDVWAFQPLRQPGKLRSVDAFIEAKLREKGLTAAPPADRRTLLRRATFDLTGLPPTPEEVEAFLKDQSGDAYEKMIDRLLASPRYGERWGRHWLDVVRYADSDGYSNDFERPNAWRYRDYVIHALNRDKPYDRFILEQLAGDELYPGNPEALIATGFLRMGPWEHTAMSVAAVTRQMFLDDVTHSTVTAFLGLTMGCARCHDHKFDPLPTRDYYRLQATFASTEYATHKLPFQSWENRTGFDRELARSQELLRLTRERMAALDDKIRQELAKKLGLEAAKLPADEVKEALRSKELLSHDDHARYNAYNKRRDIYQRAVERYQPLVYGVRDGAPVETHILTGGDLKAPAEEVSPGMLTAVRYQSEVPVEVGGRRAALARWIASPDHPLTARVMVNRIWQGHFGRGVVATSNNFGKMGKRPTHPELLDFLARAFIESGWSIKAMHRMIMRSDAYRRAATATDAEKLAKLDPENQYLSYFPPRRLSAEELRDAVLAVSGELSSDAGGPGTFPEVNEDLANQPRLIMGQFAPAYRPSPLRRERNRRSVYTFQQRTVRDPMLEVFNGPDLNESCERREASTVPTQVFALFNSKFARDSALAFAQRVENLASGRAKQVEQAYRLAMQRLPAQEELKLMLDYIARAEEHHRRVAPPPVKPRVPLVRSLVHEFSGKAFTLEEEPEPAAYEEN